MLVHAWADAEERGTRHREGFDPGWRSYETGNSDPFEVIRDTPFLDAALIFRAPDPALAWNLAAAFSRRFPKAPVVMVGDGLDASERYRAASGGIMLVGNDADAQQLRTAHAAIKYRLHDGVYHHVTHVLTDAGLTTAQFLCVLLAAAEVEHKDIIAKLTIGASGIRKHLREAARKTRSASVDAMLTTIREHARRETAARNSVLPSLQNAP